MKRTIVVVLCLCLPSWALADSVVALVGGTVYPVNAAPIPGSTVVVRGDRIFAVGRDLAVPGDAMVIDCRGKWVTPGLVDADTQIGLVEISQASETDDANVVIADPIRAAVRAEDAVDLRSTLIAVARRHGVTSAIAWPTQGLIAGQGAWIDLVDGRSASWKNAVLGPVAMRANFGEAGSWFAGGSRALALLLLREVLDDARTYKREQKRYDQNALRRLAASRLDLEALQDVLTRKLPMLVRVERAADILTVLRFAEEEHVDVVLLGAEEGWLVADEIARRKVSVIIDAFSNLPARFEQRNARADNAMLLARAGVRVAISTSSSHNAANLRFALGNAVRAGLPHEVALKAATLVPAQIAGLDRQLGTIEPGKTANLVVWSGDPFEPSTSADAVLIRGETQTLETRQTRLAARYKQRLGL